MPNRTTRMMSLSERQIALLRVSDSHETHFPVVDDDERMVGIFSLGDLRRVFMEEVIEDVIIVSDFMRE